MHQRFPSGDLDILDPAGGGLFQKLPAVFQRHFFTENLIIYCLIAVKTVEIASFRDIDPHIQDIAVIVAAMKQIRIRRFTFQCRPDQVSFYKTVNQLGFFQIT